MKHSTYRILSTHVGSLPRPEDMLEVLTAKMRGQPIDEPALDTRLPRAVEDIVRQQVDHGLDVIEPNPRYRAAYEDSYRRYGDLFRSLKPLF